MLMSKNYLSIMVRRRLVIDQYGKRQSLRKSDWQRCFLRVDGDVMKTWPSGGILLEDSIAVSELQEGTEPLDSIRLRNVHIQRLAGDGSICLHFLRGMERIIISTAGGDSMNLDSDENEKLIDSWVCVMHKAVKESIQHDLIYTSNSLHSLHSSTTQALLSPSPSSSVNFKINSLDQEFSVDLLWPGFIKYQRCTFKIQLKSGCKNISKRAICFIKSDGIKIASMSQVTSFHIISEREREREDVVSSLVIEGDGRYLHNEVVAVPIVERVLIQPVMINELRDLMIFLRDSFEILLPKPNLLTDSELEFQSIANDSARRLTEDKDKVDEILNGLVEAKPWNQSSWSDLYKCYRSKSSSISAPALNPLEFTLKMKKIGFCLKSETGKIVSTPEIEEMLKMGSDEEESIMTKLVSLHWHHIAIKN